MLTLRSRQVLGDIKCTANTITLTSIPPDQRDESGFVFQFAATKPSKNTETPFYVDTFDLFEGLGNNSMNNRIGVADCFVYSMAIMPDWVDVIDGVPIDDKEPDPYPSVDEVEIEYETELDGHCYNQEIDIPYEAKVIGKNGKDVLRSAPVFVEYCDGTNTLFEDVHVYDLDSVSTTVVSSGDISVDTGSGSVSGSANVIKSITVVSNKNNYVDLYLDMNGIISIDNLPNGLTYKNKHISGIPLKSGNYTSIINFDPNITDATSYTIRFNIPMLERIM